MNKNLLLSILFLIAVFGETGAQTVTSREDEFTVLKNANAIVRTLDVDNNPIVYCKDNTNQHHIIYHNQNYSAPYSSPSFVWPAFISGTDYTINDMVVLGDRCYCCGSYTCPDVRGVTTVGLIVRIDLSNIANTMGATVEFKFCTINKVKEFTRMDATKDNSIDDIALLGELKDPSNPSGVAFVTWNGVNWKYKVHGLNETDETLTDIVFTANGNKVITVSRLDNKLYDFCMRGELRDTAFNMNRDTLINFEMRNNFNTVNMTLQSSPNPSPTQHRNDVDMRLVADMSEDEVVTVAYECYDDTKVCEPQQQVAMFRVDLYSFPVYPMTLTGWQMVFGYFGQPNTLVDIKYLHGDNTIGLLRSCGKCSEEMTTLLQFPTWSGYGDIEALQIAPQVYASMDIYDGEHVHLVGVEPNDGHLIHFRQLKPSLDHSCYLSRPMSRSEELNLPWSLVYKLHKVPIVVKGDYSIAGQTVNAAPNNYNINCETPY